MQPCVSGRVEGSPKCHIATKDRHCTVSLSPEESQNTFKTVATTKETKKVYD